MQPPGAKFPRSSPNRASPCRQAIGLHRTTLATVEGSAGNRDERGESPIAATNSTESNATPLRSGVNGYGRLTQ